MYLQVLYLHNNEIWQWNRNIFSLILYIREKTVNVLTTVWSQGCVLHFWKQAGTSHSAHKNIQCTVSLSLEFKCLLRTASLSSEFTTCSKLSLSPSKESHHIHINWFSALVFLTAFHQHLQTGPHPSDLCFLHYLLNDSYEKVNL